MNNDVLRLHERGTENFETGIILNNAVNITEQRKINDITCLEFDYPMDEKARMIEENMLATTNGRKYEIVRIMRDMDGRDIVHVTAADMFSRRAKRTFLPNVPDMIGKTTRAVINKALKTATKFSCFTDAELEELGMNWVRNDEFLIDFFSMDKTNLWDFVQTVIENLGRGELYSDGYKFAIVDRVGKDRGVRLALDKNMQNISIQRDTENIITRLYPFGADDTPITSVNKSKAYIESPNIDLYGVYEGYKDYSDYTTPKKILANAKWEFNPENENRIDVPEITITGNLIDLSKLEEYGDIEKVELGDTVHVYDLDGMEHVERVIEGIWRPYEPETTTISIGHMRNDLFFTIYQLRHAKKQLEKVQTTNKSITTRKIQGAVNTDRNNIQSNNKLFQVIKDLLYIDDRSGTRRINLGNIDDADEEFAFELFNKLGIKTLYVDSETGNAIFGGTIRGGKIESDTDISVTRDAAVGKFLRIGFVKKTVKPDGTEVYEYQPDCGIWLGTSKILTDDENVQLNISSFNGLGKINFEANSVMKNGSELATVSAVDSLKREIQQLQLKFLN